VKRVLVGPVELDAEKATLMIVDPDGLYVPPDLVCGFGEQFRFRSPQVRTRIPRTCSAWNCLAAMRSGVRIPLGPGCDVAGHRGRMSRDIVDTFTSALGLVVPRRIQGEVP